MSSRLPLIVITITVDVVGGAVGGGPEVAAQNERDGAAKDLLRASLDASSEAFAQLFDAAER